MCECLFEKNLNETEGGDCVIKEHVYPLSQSCQGRVKFQNDLFVEVFKNYADKHKNVFYHLTVEKQIDYIENAIQKDMKFRNSLKGMVIGQFTVDEYRFYITNSSALNKRMMNIVKERLIDNIQVFQELVA